MANEQKTAKIRASLEQLDPADDKHWTDDGLPRENVVRQFAGDQTISRKDIQDAHPGFQRHAVKPAATDTVAPKLDPLTGEPTAAVAAADGGTTLLDPNADLTKNTGELMTEDEVRAVLEDRVKAATQQLADAQQAVRDANNAVIDAQGAIIKAREDLTREFPPMTPAQNVKAYIASEMAQRARAFGHNGIAPGSQIDAAMQRSNSRGWRRPSRQGPTQTGASRPDAA